ncbi:HAMP domain-containing sensor histidine kinase [Xinfangfangia sp. CPCC 101601]|uniref:histidine kinase n=1 Tax=Pseudogemmobacter lacusdianii TaxID=3069608 RepID=A0ABU0VXP8_9RHOB|nr:HAMP domain-containing sensor histidine kinase [Xinfangfangia sp. CPCC 101601]MDQ2065965.1 HAMP domain-containing sensor histidine kinase [Xinfangfangia sp. CPCC 101601]
MGVQRPWQARATWRLAAVMALAVAALSLGAMALQYRLVEARLMAAQRSLLAADLDGFAALYAQRRIIALREAIALRADLGGGEMTLLLDRQGQVLAGTLPGWPEGLARQGEGFTIDPAQEIEMQGQRWLVVARALPGDFPLLLGRSLQPVDATLAALRQGMLALLVGVLIVAGATGWLAAAWVMRRIGRLNDLADQVAAGALSARLPGPRAMDEFGLLETHVHAMLDRIESLNRATHQLSDSIAHELRTPLNRMLQRLSSLQGQEAEVAALKGEMRQTIRMFDALLDISRAEADEGGGGLLPVNLSQTAVDVWDLYEALAEDKGLIPRANISQGLMVLGDRTLLAQLLANLLDNAIKYCAPGDQLALTVAEEAGQVILRLADTGPGMPQSLRDEAFDRFTRAERDRARGIKGHGLGLALVRAIATRHGARLTLPETARGLVVELAFPTLKG